MTFTASPADPDVCKWRHVANDLRRHILGGQLSPGTRIPTEHQLCVLYGYSRTTVRQARTHLTHLGLVVSKPPHGSYVRSPG